MSRFTSRTIGRWRKFRALSALERSTFVQAAVLLPIVSLCLRVLGFRWCRALWERPVAGRHHTTTTLDEARALAGGVRLAAAHGLHHPKCLPQSILLDWLLRRRGIESSLRLGSRMFEGQLQAHAWVDVAGEALESDGATARTFIPFDIAASA